MARKKTDENSDGDDSKNHQKKLVSNDQYQVLKEKIDSMQRSIDIITSDMDQDRKYFQDFVIRLGSVESTLAEVLKSQKYQANRIANKVEDMVTPAIEEVAEETKGLRKIIRDKKVLVFKPKDGLLNFLKFWK